MANGARERSRMDVLARYELLNTEPEPAFDTLTSLAARLCHTPISLMTFMDGDHQWIKSKVGLLPEETPRDIALCAHTLNSPELLVVPDLSLDERFADNPMVKGNEHLRFYAGIPLRNAEGVSLGALCVIDRVPHQIDAEQRGFLEVLGREAMELIEIRRQASENRRRNEEQAAEIRRREEQWATEADHVRNLELQLAHYKRRLRDIERIGHLGTWEWDITQNVVSWSDELYGIYGVSPETFRTSYEAYLECIHPEDRARVKKLIEESLLERCSFTSEERIVRPDGDVHYLQVYAGMVADEQGRPTHLMGCCHDITELKSVEQKLEHSISLLHGTLQSTADGILVVDLEGHLAGYNEKFIKMWQIPATFMMSYDDQRAIELVSRQLKNPDAFLQKIQSLRKAPEAASFDVVEFKDGRIFERYSQPQRIRDKIVGRVWSFRDVTGVHHAFRTLQRSEERYRSLTVATSQIVWTTNADGMVVEDVPTWRNFTGQKFHELLGRGWMDAVHPKDRQRIHDIWMYCLKTHELCETEYRLRRADGEWRHMWVRGVPIKDHHGNVIEWVGFCMDITEEKNAAAAVLRERDLSEAIINSLPGIFYMIDEGGHQIRWNKNMQEVTEYPSSEFAGLTSFDIIAPEERELIAGKLKEVVTAGQADTELTLVTKSGKRIPYYCTGKHIVFEGKSCIIGMGVDISQHKQAEQQIKKLNETLERRVRERTAELDTSNRELQAFSYSVSHDLRAPLRAINGFAKSLHEDYGDKLDDDGREYVQRILRAGERMTHLIEDLLAYSRIGRTSISLRPVSLKPLLDQIAAEFVRRLTAIGGTLSIAEDLPSVSGDVSLLSQIFTNILDNAITYRKQDVPLAISVTHRLQDKDVVVSISDNGIGIAPAHHQRIFEVFQRLHTEQQYPGTGIGLANVKKSVETLGGDVWVESEDGKGSTFCVLLKPATPPQSRGP